MSRSKLKFGFLMDPLDKILPDKDTTFVFMLESQKRGHEVLYFTPRDMFAAGGTVRAITRRAEVRRATPHYSLGDPVETDLTDLDVVFFRTDPPFDMEYLYQTYLLDLIADKVFVTNNPSAVRAANEKLFTLNYENIIPTSLVTTDALRIKSFMIEAGGRIVIKPLNRAGGDGVFVLENGDRNVNAIIETSTYFGRTRVIAQKYVPEVRDGDKRILLLDGEFLGATLRVPLDDENRSNIHVGGKCIAYKLTERDKEIVSRVGPELKRRGLHFVGLDVLGDYLTEINVTSPTGIQEIDRLDNVCIEAQVIDFVEAQAELLGK